LIKPLFLKFRGWVGSFLDFIGMAQLNFKNPHSYTKFRIIKSVKKKSGSKVFIEAGTYFGITADRCSKIFDQVYTIELNETLARNATAFLSARENVNVIKGDALKVLPELLEGNRIQNALIYLDGHVCGPTTSSGDFPEPAVEELKSLSFHKEKINAIVIDDFRSFGVEKNFPEKSALIKAAEDNFPSDLFHIFVEWDQLVIIRKN